MWPVDLAWPLVILTSACWGLNLINSWFQNEKHVENTYFLE